MPHFYLTPKSSQPRLWSTDTWWHLLERHGALPVLAFIALKWLEVVLADEPSALIRAVSTNVRAPIEGGREVIDDITVCDHE
jgi:hypothetical protein